MGRNLDVRFRRGTAATWTAANPTLNAGEPGIETDTNSLKIGDGATAWNALPYVEGGGPTQLPNLLYTASKPPGVANAVFWGGTPASFSAGDYRVTPA